MGRARGGTKTVSSVKAGASVRRAASTPPAVSSNATPRAMRRVFFDHGNMFGKKNIHACLIPRITATFTSPMVNRGNIRANGDMTNQELVARVIAGLKPWGSIGGPAEEMGPLVAQARAAKVAVRCGRSGYKNWWFANITQHGIVGEHMNIPALIADYQHYFAADEREREIAREITRALRRVAKLDFADFLSDEHCPLAEGRAKPAEIAVCGLLLGYPVESTVGRIRDFWLR